MNKQVWVKPFIWVGVVILLCFMLPAFLPEYYITVITFLLIDIILAVGFRLIATTGLFSFTHISLMGLGGYISGLLVTRLGWTFWITLPLAVLSVALFSLLIGFPLLRTRATQFFLTTYAAGEAIRWSWIILKKPFGGYPGIGVVPRPNSILTLNFDSSTPYYYLVLIFTLLGLLIMYKLEKSRIGDTFKSIALNEEICESIGINTYGYKALAFVVGSAFAGLAGVLLTHYTRTASPGDYTFVLGLNIFIFVIVGGLNSFIGPIVGAIVLIILGELLRGLHEYLPFVYGVILITTVLILPGGLASLPRRILNLLKGHTRKA